MPAVEIEREDEFDQTFALKVFTKGLVYDYKMPWSTPQIKNWTGSGFVIEGRKIITNAHVAGNARFIEVQLANDSTKYPAKIEAIGHDCDLAILSVVDEDFWKKTKSIPVGDHAAQTQKVEAHGFPMGGSEYCITEGTVSRIERHYYVHGETEHFIYQISAAINPGNSGGAVVSTNPMTGEKEVVGVAHQGYTKGQNIAYMIPAAVLKHFVAQVERSGMGFPGVEMTTQMLDNPHMREKYKLQKEQTGVLVNSIAELSSAHGRLKDGDVLLSINDIPIQNDGSVRIKGIGKIHFNYVINNCMMGETLEFKILRDGKELYEHVKLKNKEGDTRRIFPMEYDKSPTYFILGGLIPIQPLTRNFMSAVGMYYPDKHKKLMDDEILVINRILSKDDYTKGYSDAQFSGELIYSVNGVVVHNMQDVIRATENNVKSTHTIITRSAGEYSEIVIPNLNLEERKAELKEALKLNGVPSDRSDDLITPAQKKERQLEEVMDAAGKTLFFKRVVSDKKAVHFTAEPKKDIKTTEDLPKAQVEDKGPAASEPNLGHSTIRRSQRLARAAQSTPSLK